MRRESIETVMLVAASIASGWIGWSGYVLLLPAALVFPMLWSVASSRIAAALVSVGYFLASSRGLPQGVGTFYATDFWPGLLLWLAAATSFVIVHAVLWTSARAWRPARYLSASRCAAVNGVGRERRGRLSLSRVAFRARRPLQPYAGPRLPGTGLCCTRHGGGG